MDESDFNTLYENIENLESRQIKHCKKCLSKEKATGNYIIDGFAKKYSVEKIYDALNMIDQIGGEESEGDGAEGSESCDNIRKELGEVRDQLAKANSEIPSKRRALQKVMRRNKATEKSMARKLAKTAKLEKEMRSRGLANAKQIKAIKLGKKKAQERMKKLKEDMAKLKKQELESKQASTEKRAETKKLKQEKSSVRQERKALEQDMKLIKSQRNALKKQNDALKRLQQMNAAKQADLIKQEKTLKSLIKSNTKTRGRLTKQKQKLTVKEKKLADKTRIFKNAANKMNSELSTSSSTYKTKVKSGADGIEKSTDELINQIQSHLKQLEKFSK